MKGRIKKTIITVAVFIIIQLTYVFLAQSITINQNSKNSFITVDKNGNGEYTSIQEAINYAAPGSTIYVKNGEYPEIIQIKKTIQLIGEDKNNTLINPISEENK